MISLHVIADFCPPERLDRAFQYLVRTKPPTVNIAGGAQMDRAMQFAERVRSALPNIVIQFRVLEDTGVMVKLTPDEWITRYILPRSLWLKANKIVLVTDNETSGNDDIISRYVNRSCIVADALHAHHLNGVFCRFATGNIAEGQYSLLKPLLERLNSGDWVGPNEYSNLPGKSSGGHLERYKRIELVAGKQLNMSIGECGVLDDYKSQAGYRGHMNGRDMAAQLLGEEMWYRGGTIPRHLFAIGGGSEWDTLQVGNDALGFLEEYYQKQSQPVVVTPPPVVVPPKPPTIPDPPQNTTKTVSVPVSSLKSIRTSLIAALTIINGLIPPDGSGG